MWPRILTLFLRSLGCKAIRAYMLSMIMVAFFKEFRPYVFICLHYFFFFFLGLCLVEWK